METVVEMPRVRKRKNGTFNHFVKSLDEENPRGKQEDCHNSPFHVNFNHDRSFLCTGTENVLLSQQKQSNSAQPNKKCPKESPSEEKKKFYILIQSFEIQYDSGTSILLPPAFSTVCP